MDVALFIVQLITALGAASAAIVAAIAVRHSQATVKRDREHQLLRDRHADAVALLMAFEEVRSGELVGWGGNQSYDVRIQSAAYARLRARIRAWPERLPVLEQIYLERGSGDEATVTAAIRKVQEEPARNEILDILRDLRRQLGQS